jgi:ribosomal protein S18 acetylase RimI-like enzyme
MALATHAITLRPVGPRDEDILLAVYASTRAEELMLVSWGERQREAFLRHQFTAQAAHYREHYAGASYDVIEVDGEAVGRFYVARWDDEIRVMDIALLPEHRGAGIGTSLLQDVLAEGARTDKKVSIHVEPHNPARRLYERLGFQPVAEHGLYLLLEARPA